MGTTLAIVGCVGLFWMSVMFKTSLILWGQLLVFLLYAIKWTFIIGFITSFLNLPQMYSYVGWTPASIVFGPAVYDRSLKTLNLPDPRKPKGKHAKSVRSYR